MKVTVTCLQCSNTYPEELDEIEKIKYSDKIPRYLSKCPCCNALNIIEMQGKSAKTIQFIFKKNGRKI
jgi:hypothetical protein